MQERRVTYAWLMLISIERASRIHERERESLGEGRRRGEASEQEGQESTRIKVGLHGERAELIERKRERDNRNRN